MLGGLALVSLALFGYMGTPVWVVVPVSLAGAAIKPLAARDRAVVWRWRAAAKALPLTTGLALAAFGLGWGLGRLGP